MALVIKKSLVHFEKNAGLLCMGRCHSGLKRTFVLPPGFCNSCQAGFPVQRISEVECQLLLGIKYFRMGEPEIIL